MNTVCLDCHKIIPKPPSSSHKAGRCPDCARRHQQRRDAARGTAAQRGYDADWRKVRVLVLNRDGWCCHYCGAPAITVDHVVPLARGGARLDPFNLVACCRSCNARRGGAARRGAAWSRLLGDQ
jgi:5-methylcytosine-specific restriction endonuclease McrA